MRGLELLDMEMPSFIPMKKVMSHVCSAKTYRTMKDAQDAAFERTGYRRAYQCRVCTKLHAGGGNHGNE